MFDSHDDDLWEVPSIDVDVPVEEAVPVGEAVPAEEAVPAPEPFGAVPVESAGTTKDESSTDGYD